MNTELSNEEKYNYALGVLKNNVFFDFEVDYYSGKTGKNPHGIEDSIWEAAFNSIDGKIIVNPSIVKDGALIK